MSEHITAQNHLTHAGAKAIVAAAVAKATELGVPINVAVADTGGNLMAFERMDQAMIISGSIAIDKAWTVAAAGGLSTQQFYEVVAAEPELKLSFPHRDRLVLFGGGVPVKINDELVASVGVSGGSAAEDAEIATAGANAVA